MRGFLNELRRRRVLPAAGLYLVAAWAAIEVSDTIFPLLGLPAWAPTLVLALALVGFPVALALAWVYDVRPLGIERDGGARATPAADRTSPAETTRPIEVPVTDRRSIAVLPFANLSADPENEFFSDGVTEEILDALTKIRELRVASRTAAWAFKGRNPDVAEVGRKLRVGTMLEGSVRRAAGRVRITVQLVDAATGYHLWSERYDRELTDLFAVQEDIARRIVDALRVKLHEGEAEALVRAPTRDLVAYEEYLRGRAGLDVKTTNALAQAAAAFHRAVERDPTFARAWAGLANTLTIQYLWHDSDPALLEEAIAASERALKEGPDLAEARVAHGHVLALMRRYDEAEREFEEGLRLDPTSYDAWYWYGRARLAEGRTTEAIRLFEAAHRVQPDEYQALGLAMGQQHPPDEKAAAEVLAVIERHLELHPDDPRAVYFGAYAHFFLGRPDEARAWAERAGSMDPDDPGVLYNTACLNARLGEPERALDQLERIAANGALHRDWLAHDEDLASLREHPRFQRLLEALG